MSCIESLSSDYSSCLSDLFLYEHQSCYHLSALMFNHVEMSIKQAIVLILMIKDKEQT